MVKGQWDWGCRVSRRFWLYLWEDQRILPCLTLPIRKSINFGPSPPLVWQEIVLAGLRGTFYQCLLTLSVMDYVDLLYYHSLSIFAVPLTHNVTTRQENWLLLLSVLFVTYRK